MFRNFIQRPVLAIVISVLIVFTRLLAIRQLPTAQFPEIAPTTVNGKEHWKRIWALSSRLSTQGLGDEYDNLKPVADLRKQIQDRLYSLLQSPLRWDPIEPTDDTHKQQVFDGVANALSAKILDLATRRVCAERMPEWQSAFNQSGRGSSYARASIIGERIYDRAAPIPDVTPSPDWNSFLHKVAAVVEGVCQEMGATLS